MEITVKTKNLSKYLFSDFEFIFPLNKTISKEKYTEYDNECNTHFEIKEILKKNNIIILNDIGGDLFLRNNTNTNDNFNNDDFIEIDLDFYKDLNKKFIIIYVEIYNNRFLLVYNTGKRDNKFSLVYNFDLKLKELINFIDHKNKITNNTKININAKTYEFEDCIERKLINLLRDKNNNDGYYYFRYSNEDKITMDYFILDDKINSKEKPEIYLPKRINLNNKILNILSKKKYKSLIEKNEKYFNEQKIDIKNIYINVNVPKILKNIIIRKMNEEKDILENEKKRKKLINIIL